MKFSAESDSAGYKVDLSAEFVVLSNLQVHLPDSMEDGCVIPTAESPSNLRE